MAEILVDEYYIEKLKNKVSQQTGERECDHFTSTIDKLCDFVDENKQYFVWDEYDGDLYQMILWLINMRDDIDHFYIGEYDNDIDYDKD